MKLTAILLLTAVLQVSARTEGQTITLKVKNAPMKDVFREIQKQSGLNVLIDEVLLERAGKVTLDVKDMPVPEVLNLCLRNEPLSYSIIDGRIVVKPTLTPALQPKDISPIAADIPPPPIDIRGRVTNENGEPVEGASITIKGTNRGTATDAGGNFTLQVPDGGGVLVISYVGYQTIERTVSKATTAIKIVLKQAETKVEDIVVIGYGTQRKIEVTGAVAHVNSDDFIKGSVKDAGQLLQGKIAGLAINNVSGDPTASSQILLRGISTLYSSTQPLILIDGIPGDLATVMPNDIESIDVLKDGSAAAIYGTRGTNGVIIVNTRRARGTMKATITYDGWVSTEEFTRLPKVFSASEYREKISQGVPFSDLGASTDWVKELTRKNPISHNHNLSVSGGNAKTNYFGSFNYRDRKGVVLQSDYQTINTRLGLNHNMFNDRLKINIGLIANENNSPGVDFNQSTAVGINDGSAPANFINEALIRNPTEPILNPDGTWYENTVLFSFNPLGILKESFGDSKAVSTRVSGSVTWEPVENLHLKALAFRGQADFQSGIGLTKRHVSNTKAGSRNGFATKNFGKSTDNLLELTADYSRQFNDHKITGVVGYSYQENLNESTFMQNYDFPAGNFSYIDNIGLGAAIQRGEGSMSSSKFESNLIGFFGRLNYNYKEKYLLMGSLRYEASSKLEGTNDPWGLFPAISAGWRISEEDFMKGSSIFNNLKLRAGYGVTGTAPSPYFLGVELLGFSGQIFYNGQWVRSLAPISNPNPYLRWEEKKETNIGLDFGILKGRLSGSIDYYNRTTDGLLYAYAVPTPPNAFGITVANVGVMKNNGLEILLSGSPVQSQNFTWNSTVTFSTNKNKLVSISNELFKATQDWFNTGSFNALNTETYTHRVEVGKPIGNFYGHKVIDITDDGRWVYEDKDGKPTTDRLEENKKVIGNGLPKYFASWNNTLRYGNFDFYVNMRGAFGFEILNYQRMNMENPKVRLGNNQLKSAYDKVFGKAVLSSGATAEYNSYYIEKGNFVKIDNISLGYSFKNLKHVAGSRVYVSVLNGIILTHYKGMDPEVPLLGLAPGNDDASKYPSTRVYSIGWNLTFN